MGPKRQSSRLWLPKSALLPSRRLYPTPTAEGVGRAIFSTVAQPIRDPATTRVVHTLSVAAGHVAQWFGTRSERRALLTAIRRHCTCTRDADGMLLEPCPSHHMLVHEQRALDGLVFVRRLADRLRREEWE